MQRDRRTLLMLAAMVSIAYGTARGETMSPKPAIIDDLSRDPPVSAIGTRWQLFTDRVMGGVFNGTMVREVVDGRPAIRMRGDVSVENNGGFVQIAIDLSPDGKAVDASAWQGIELDVFGNNEEYGIHLRTEDLNRPWQFYRHLPGQLAVADHPVLLSRLRIISSRDSTQYQSATTHWLGCDRPRVFG